jgi:hypothetical protein
MGKVSPSGENSWGRAWKEKAHHLLASDEWVGEGGACYYIPDYHWLKYIQKINVKNARNVPGVPDRFGA